jgi:hypothetical protein
VQGRGQNLGRVNADSDLTLRVGATSPDPLRLFLLPGAMVTGQLSGRPLEELAEARITALSQRHHTGQLHEEGSYSVGPLAPGYWRLTARLPDGHTAAEMVHIEEGQTEAQVNLEFPATVSLTVEVLQGALPLPAVEVTALRPGEVDVERATTDAQGRAAFRHLLPGLYRLEVLDPETRTLLHGEELEVSADTALQLILDFGTLLGTVQRRNGGPLPDVRVTLEPETPSRTAGPLAYTTDLAGQFTADSLPPGRWRLTARKTGVAAVKEEVSIEPGEVAAVTLKMDPGGELNIRLLPAPGFPALPDEVTVTLYDPNGEAHFFERTPTLPGGLVQLSGVPSGVWDLEVSDTSGLLAAEVRGVSLPGAEVTAQLKEMGVLRIVVPEMLEQGLVGRVELRDAAGRAPLGFNGEGFRGQGVLRGIPVGEWVVRVVADTTQWTKAMSVHHERLQAVLLD